MGANFAVLGGLSPATGPSPDDPWPGDTTPPDVVVGISGCYYEDEGKPIHWFDDVSGWGNKGADIYLLAGDQDTRCPAWQSQRLASALRTSPVGSSAQNDAARDRRFGAGALSVFQPDRPERRFEALTRAELAALDDHDGVMVTEHDLLAEVDAAFEVTGRGLASWPDPHPDRSPLDDEYSRLTNPSRWRILGARADAWLVAVVDAGLATVERSAAVRWKVPPRTVISRTDHVAPYATGALPLVLARSQLGPVDDAGVTLGVGDPAIGVAWFPDCGCDACDSGSQDELDDLDAHILGIVSGAFRRLSTGNREITVIGEDGWTASGLPARYDVDAVLSDPTGWDEIAGTSWLHHV